MSLNPTKQLGKMLSNTNKEVETVKENIHPDDPSAVFPIFIRENVGLEGTVKLYNRRMEGVYIVGHPVYGEIGAYPIGPLCVLNHPFWAFLNDCILGDRDEDQYERTLIQTINI